MHVKEEDIDQQRKKQERYDIALAICLVNLLVLSREF